MNRVATSLFRSLSVRRLAAGCVLAIGFASAALSSASADGWKHKHHGDDGYRGYYYAPPAAVYARPYPVYVRPRPVYVAPAPVYYPPQPVYVAPAPVYYPPAPVVYGAPSVNVVIPLHF